MRASLRSHASLRAFTEVTLKLSECELASEFDPSFLRQFNGLARRSALGPPAE